MSFTPTIVAALALAFAGAPSPAPTLPPDDSVTPGFGGFAVIALLVVAVFALVWDMQRRVRRARYRSEIDARLDAENEAGRGGGDAATPASGRTTDDEPRGEGPRS